ncbi:MAG: tight adherence protein [Clostridiales bacterium]|nr:tight adherence protein [Clostridiales bacterium]
MIDYRSVTYQKKDALLLMGYSVALLSALSYLFYDNIVFFLILSPIGLLLYRRDLAKKRKKRSEVLNQAFKEMLHALVSALTAGYSIENSFVEAQRDLSLLYANESDIMQELIYINQQIHCNQRIEDLLSDFARRSNLEDIQSFTEVFVIAKKSGGNFLGVLCKTAENINDKIEIRREIQTLVAGKQMEANIMMLIPMGILGYLRIFSKGFLDALYHNYFGILVMSVSLFLYGLSVFLAEKIVDIEV